MPTLDNHRHEKFAQEIFSGKNATEAYRAVYGEKKTAEVTSAVAARLLGIARVHARLRELQAEAADKNQITVESMIKEFANAAKDAKTDKQHGAVVSALTAVAKLAGFWVDRAENLNGNYAISDKLLTDEEWAERFVKD
jgi:phage terminase small subunit